MPDGKHGWPGGGPRQSRLHGVGLPAALVGASVVLLLIVVATSALLGGGPGIIPLSAHASSADQGRVLDKQTQAASVSQAAPGAPVAGGFQPVSMEAEAATLRGSAVKSDCDDCSGHAMVRFVGGAGADTGIVTFSGLKVPVTGTYHLTIGCVLGGFLDHGPFLVSVDGAVAATATCPLGSWSSATPTTVTITLKAGVSHTLALGNPTIAAPDLDGITLSQ
jgi:hypothetical protein